MASEYATDIELNEGGTEEVAFDPTSKVRRLSGSEYLDVKWRIVWLRQDHPHAIIDTELVSHYEDREATNPKQSKSAAVFKATVTLPDGQGSATGWGSETRSDFNDYLEKAETKAIGRACQHLGYGTASLPDDGDRIADAPVERGRPQYQQGGSTRSQPPRQQPRTVEQVVQRQPVRVIDPGDQAPASDDERVTQWLSQIDGIVNDESLVSSQRVGKLRYTLNQLQARWPDAPSEVLAYAEAAIAAAGNGS